MEFIKRKFGHYIRDKLVTGSIIISVGIFTASVINYLTQIFLGRNMSVEDYGTYNSLFSLTVIISIPSAALITSLIKTVADMRVKNDFKAISKMYKELTKYMALVGLILGGIILVFQTAILNYLNISESVLIYPFSFFVIASLLNNVPSGYLQGLLRFKGFGFYTIFRAGIRLVIVLAAVLLGYKTLGALLGVGVASFISYLVGFAVLKKNISEEPASDVSRHFKKLLNFSATVLLIRASLTLLSSVDLILVKHFFTPVEAGIYAGLTTIGKIIFFGTGIFSTVMFTIIADTMSKGMNYMKKFFSFFLLHTAIVVLSVIVFSLFPEFITHTMFGRDYSSAIVHLPKYALAIGLFSFVNFIYHFLLAVESSKSYVILIAGVVIQFILINIYHPSLDTIININILTMCAILLASIVPFKQAAFKTPVRS